MTHKRLKSIQALEAPKGTEWDAPSSVYSVWQPVKAAASDDKNTINILDRIGETFDGSGMTAKLVNSILRSAKGEDITVNVNSPGGDFFEGTTIYNLLREYEGAVNIKVLGVAASAASIIAMAADELKIAKSASIMIHNAWGLVIGNQHDLRQAADTFSVFDESMGAVYADRTGLPMSEIAALMDDETFLSGEKAVNLGFADAFLDSDQVVKDDERSASAKHKIDIILAKNGMPRSERRAIYQELSGTQNAADTTHNAGSDELAKALSSHLADVKGINSNV